MQKSDFRPLTIALSWTVTQKFIMNASVGPFEIKYLFLPGHF